MKTDSHYFNADHSSLGEVWFQVAIYKSGTANISTYLTPEQARELAAELTAAADAAEAKQKEAA